MYKKSGIRSIAHLVSCCSPVQECQCGSGGVNDGGVHGTRMRRPRRTKGGRGQGPADGSAAYLLKD